MFMPGVWILWSKKKFLLLLFFKKKMEILLHFLSFSQWKDFKKSKIAQIYYHDPQSAGINLQSPQSDSTPWTLTVARPLLFCNYFKTVLLAIARTCQYLVDLDLSNCHIINTGSFGILSKLTSLQVSISCSIKTFQLFGRFKYLRHLTAATAAITLVSLFVENSVPSGCVLAEG